MMALSCFKDKVHHSGGNVPIQYKVIATVSWGALQMGHRAVSRKPLHRSCT